MSSLFCGSFALLQTEHIFVLEINLYVFLSWCHGCCCTCSRVTPTPIIPLSLQLGSIVTVLWLAGIFPMPSATVRLAEFGSFCNVLSGLLAPIERKCVGCPHWLVTTIPLSLSFSLSCTDRKERHHLGVCERDREGEVYKSMWESNTERLRCTLV